MEKLIRDKIPSLAWKKGEEIRYRIADGYEYHLRLREKLLEELAGFLKDWNIEEMGDVLDVLEAYSSDMGWDFAVLLSTSDDPPSFPGDVPHALVQAVSLFMAEESPERLMTIIAALRQIATNQDWLWESIETTRKQKTHLKGGFRQKIIATFSDRSHA